MKKTRLFMDWLRIAAIPFFCTALHLAAVFSEHARCIAQTSENQPPGKRGMIVSAADLPHAAENWLVAVGINTFYDPTVSSLLYCEADAKAIHEFFTESGLVQEHRAFLLTTGSRDKDLPSRGNVFKNIGFVATQATTESTILIFLAGHGFEDDRTGQSYFFPMDGSRDNLARDAVSIHDINEILQKSPANRKILFIDACRSNPGAGRGGDSDSKMTEIFFAALKSAAGQITMAACDAGQTSYENPESGHGVFTEHVLRGLRGEAEPDKEGIIDVASLQKYLAKAVGKWAERNQYPPQTPWLLGEMSSPIPLAVVQKDTPQQSSGSPGGSSRPPAKTDGVDLGDGVRMELVHIKGGTFQMGSPSTETGRYDDEGPIHEVTVGDFYIGRYEVTQQQYEKIMGMNPSLSKDPNKPVENVSWEDAMDFCKKLSEKTGKKITLPTEAQWEYACRAGTKTRFSFGDKIPQTLAIHNQPSTLLGADRMPNTFGVHHMHGNVSEWCLSLYQSYPYRDGSGRNDLSARGYRVVRGGSWQSKNERNYRSATRWHEHQEFYTEDIGFRVVLLISD